MLEDARRNRQQSDERLRSSECRDTDVERSLPISIIRRERVIDWFEDPDVGQPLPEARHSWMRLYIVAGLVGVGAFGVIGGLLHILPA